MNVTQKPMGRIRRGWELTKSSWRVLKLDKELIAIPILSGVLSVVVVAIAVAIVASLLGANYVFDSTTGEASTNMGSSGYIISFSMYLLVTFIVNFFGAAITYGAIERFRGKDPTVGSSIDAARRHTVSIAIFSLISSTIGFVLQAIENRVPLAGKISTWILQATWSIASMFAVPVIVMNDKPTGPIEATRKSVNIIKKAWGESVVSQIGLGLIQLLYTFGWIALFAVITIPVSINASSAGADIAIPLIVSIALFSVFVIGLIVISIIFSTLAAIAKAAVYYYATTGKSPEVFNKHLLQESMTSKKARKIFA